MADDVIIFGEGKSVDEATADHDHKMVRLLERCQKKGIILNKEKFKLKLTEVPYIRHLLTKNGLKPDPSKVEAILKMNKPEDVKGVQRLVGLVNYLAKFLPNLTHICQPLRQLTCNGVAWNWEHEHDTAFKRIQDAITSAPVLKYFDPAEETHLQCDASETGLGASLIQNGQQVACASRALTSTEQNNAQIEKELLSIVFGVEKFHQYTYGRKVHVGSDHKPLETIHTKPLVSASKRLQRILLRLQRYDLEIKYTPGKDMHLADTLSRAYLSNTTSENTAKVMQGEPQLSATEVEVQHIKMSEYLPITKARLTEI